MDGLNRVSCPVGYLQCSLLWDWEVYKIVNKNDYNTTDIVTEWEPQVYEPQGTATFQFSILEMFLFRKSIARMIEEAVAQGRTVTWRRIDYE